MECILCYTFNVFYNVCLVQLNILNKINRCGLKMVFKTSTLSCTRNKNCSQNRIPQPILPNIANVYLIDFFNRLSN